MFHCIEMKTTIVLSGSSANCSFKLPLNLNSAQTKSRYLIYELSLAHVQSTNMEGTGFMAYNAAKYQRTNQEPLASLLQFYYCQ